MFNPNTKKNVKTTICAFKAGFVLELFLDDRHCDVRPWSITLPGLGKPLQGKIIEAATMSPLKCLKGFPSHIVPHVSLHILCPTTLLTYHTLHDIIYILYHIADYRDSPQSSCRAVMMRGPEYWTRQQRKKMINGLLMASLRQWPFMLINIYSAINFLNCV